MLISVLLEFETRVLWAVDQTLGTARRESLSNGPENDNLG